MATCYSMVADRLELLKNECLVSSNSCLLNCTYLILSWGLDNMHILILYLNAFMWNAFRWKPDKWYGKSSYNHKIWLQNFLEEIFHIHYYSNNNHLVRKAYLLEWLRYMYQVHSRSFNIFSSSRWYMEGWFLRTSECLGEGRGLFCWPSANL